MGKSCWIKPTVERPDGKKVRSKLFDDIYRLTGADHNLSVKLYNIARSDTFINAVADQAEFDENGQITARSFFNLSGYIDDIDDIAKKLNEQYSMTTKDIQEALDFIESFNVNESFSEDYIPIVRTDDRDNISVSIVERNSESVADLEDQLEKNKLTQLIRRRLKNLGVAYDFVGTSQHSGKFSTHNAIKMSDGLVHLIELSTNKNTNVEDTIVEEAAHLATVSMKDSSLIQRLLASLNEETIKDLFSGEEIDLALLNTEEGRLELAGLLVKKSMQNKPLLGYSTFFWRIKDAIYKVFSKLHLDDILSDKKKAKLYARQIANRFLYDESEIDISKTKDIDIELFSKNLSGANKLLNDALSEIDVLKHTVKEYSSEFWRDAMGKQFNRSKILNGKQIDEITYEEAVGFAAEAMTNLVDKLNDIAKLLNGIDLSKDVKREDVVALYTATEITKTLSNLKTVYDTFIKTQDEYDSKLVGPLKKALDHFVNSIEQSNISSSLLEYQRTLTAMVIGEILGKDEYVSMGRIALSNWTIYRKNSWKVNKYQLATQYLYESQDNIINVLGDWFRGRMFARDITTQLFDREIRKLKYNEAKRYRESLSELEVLKDRVKKAGIDVTDFYEKYADSKGHFTGDYTGYLISPFNRHQFELDKQNATKKCTVEFLKKKEEDGTLDEFNKKTASAKRIEFDNYKESSETWKKFVEESYDDYSHNILKLSKYDNTEYARLVNQNPQFEELLKDIKEWLSNLNDTCLRERFDIGDELDDVMEGELSDEEDTISGYKHYVDDRIPQFKRRTIERIFNSKKNLSDNNTDLYDGENLRKINLDITSKEFGSPLLNTSLNEFNDEISVANDQVRSIPLYGINELEDMRELSSKLFESMALYAQMAWRFHTSQEILPVLLLVDDTLSNRRQLGGLNNTNYKSTSQRQRQQIIDEFLLSSTKGENGARQAVKKTVGTMAMLASIRVLCLSVIPAVKNFFGGLRVPMNDAISGRSDMKFSHLLAATIRGINPVHSFGSQFAQAFSGREVEWDRYRNLMRRWDAARNPIIKEVRGNTALKTAFNYLTNIVMLNYSITDEQLMHIIYDAHMSSITLYDAAIGKDNGSPKKINLVKDGYEYKEHNRPELKKSIVKSATDVHYWRILNDAYQDVISAIDGNKKAEENSIRKSAEDLKTLGAVQDELDKRGINESLMNENNGSFKTLKEIKKIIEDQFDSICFTEKDEYAYCEKINDYIATSQGLYGALNANEIQNDAYAAMIGKLKGWLFGFMQRNLMSHESVVGNGHKQAVLQTEAIAICSLFSKIDKRSFRDSALNSRDADYQFNSAKFRLCVALATFLPFVANTNNKISIYLRKCGFDPDQLANLSYFIMGRILNWMIFGLTMMFYRGNYQEVAEANKEYGGNKKLVKEGIIFRLFNLIDKNEKKAKDSFNDWRRQGYPHSMNQKKNIDGRVSTKNNLPSGDKLKKLKSTAIYKVKDTGKYYKIKEDANGNRKWVETSYGFYQKNTDEWNRRYDAIRFGYYQYDTHDPMYILNSNLYRLGRGVLSEGLSLMSPRQMLSDLSDLTSPIVWTAGIAHMASQADNLIKTIEGEKEWSEFWTKTANFWCNKLFFEIDEDGMPHWVDQYEKQKKADRYRKSRDDIKFKPTLQQHIDQL